MRRTLLIGLAVLIVVVALVGTGLFPKSGGGKTQRPWTKTDVVGTWQYSCPYPKATILITFNADGSFDQTVAEGTGKTIKQRGKWAIGRDAVEPPTGFAEGYVNVYEVLSTTGDDPNVWKPLDWTWWEMRDSATNLGGFAIFGGHFPDPDVFEPFRKVPSPTTTNSTSSP